MERLYQVSGCSMEPTLSDGQIVEVMEGYEEGDVVVAEHEGRLIVKRLVGDRLLGDNRALSADFFVADVRILGRVEVRTKEELEERGVQLDNLHIVKVEAIDVKSKVMVVSYDIYGDTRLKVKAGYKYLIVGIDFDLYEDIKDKEHEITRFHSNSPYTYEAKKDATLLFYDNTPGGTSYAYVVEFPATMSASNLEVVQNYSHYYDGGPHGRYNRADVFDLDLNYRYFAIGDGSELRIKDQNGTELNPFNSQFKISIPANVNRISLEYKHISNLLILREKVNEKPILTLSTQNNHALSEGSVLPITGSASDADKGDVVTVKYKINSGTVRNIASGVANGTPLSFAKNLTFSNKRLRDGFTEITGDLAENVDHTLTVWAEDDKGEKSAEVTRKFRVIHNRPPVISGTNEDLGNIQAIPSKTYTVTEPEKDAFTVTEKINGTVIRSFAGVAEQENTITIPHDLWIRLQPRIQHKLVIEATDSKGMTAARTYTFVRQENKLEFKLKKPFVTDIAARRILVTIDAVVPNGAMMKIEACNNAFDASPTWEDITNHVRFNRGFLFTNTEKTAEQWGVDIRFMFEKGTANSQVIVNGFGGAFD
ncbi:S26 family signal peptidase [Aneurinibacillus migulanus]|uniref:S26 family signal peptidase n=1 Tax=Aneurinibacillus migulanus TaxID=47500 RepID=UPI002E2498BA|nr:S26 family signal peptidase [Aneurinibacillus migulanus]